MKILLCSLLALSGASAHAATISSGGGSVSAVALQPAEAAPGSATRFVSIAPEESGIDFVNRYDDPRMWGALYREFTLGAVGSGVAIGDFDGDGQPDIFAVSKTGQNKLFRQTAPFQFDDVTEAAGILDAQAWSVGATFVDIDNDGWLDLYVCHFNAPNQLFINQGDGTFVERAGEYGLAVKDASVMAAFADYDRDGHLDLYLQTNILDYQQSFKGQPDYLFRNNGDGTFSDVTAEAGIWGISQGHSATWWDYNNDGWPDLYVANDFENSDRLYQNNGDGTFTDALHELIPHTSYFSMGSDLGDVNNDGLVDFFVGDMAATTHYKDKIGMAEMGRGIWENERVSSLFPMYMRNAFYLNTGVERFSEIAYLTRLDASDWTWAVKFADFDNSGWLDLYITNGNIRNFMDADLLDRQNVASSLAARARVYRNAEPLREHNLAYRNDGDLAFSNVSKDWGLDHFGISFGAAVADLDRDGRLDLVVNNFDEPLSVYRNVAESGGGLLIRLQGTVSNAFGIGATVLLESSHGTQTRQHTLARGALSSDEPLIHFGLGSDESAKRLTVKWPSGIRQELEGLSPGQLYTIVEPENAESARPIENAVSSARSGAQFQESTELFGLDWTHQESYYNDLANQPLLPRRLSRLGPGIAMTALDDTGRRALALAGAAGHPTTVLIESSDGAFAPVDDAPWNEHANAETSALLWFDANGDGLLDLYAAHGSVEQEAGDPSYADRLYFNTGEGSFAESPSGTLPQILESTGAVAAADFDGNQTLDLFIGARSVPGRYPETPRSHLLQNEGGRFIDVTDKLAPGLPSVGMVTAAIWSDANGDGKPDLLIAREWDSIAFFRNTENGLVDATAEAGFAPFTGWWNSIAAADVNGDGLMDYVVGNVGLNTKYLASPERPTVLYYGEFDASGRRHLIEAQYEDGDDKLYPIRPFSKLRYSIPELGSRFSTFHEFAQSTLEEVFGEESLKRARRLEANTLESGVFVNQGDGSFVFQPLPRLAQTAPVYGIVAQDLNGDGHVDLYLAQNSHSPEPTTGRFHGGLSLLLHGDGKGGFTPAPAYKSGLMVTGDAKAAVVADMEGNGWPDLLVSQNSGPLLAFNNRGVDGATSFSVALKGTTGNPSGIGARIQIERQDGSSSFAEIHSNAGYLSQSPAAAFFGYTEANAPVSIVVRWPDGSESRHSFETGQPSITIAQPD